MQKFLVALFIVAFVAVALLGSAQPARAAAPSIDAQWCAWLNHQHSDAFVNGRWRAGWYDVDLLCSRTERIDWRIGEDDHPTYGSVLAAWAK